MIQKRRFGLRLLKTLISSLKVCKEALSLIFIVALAHKDKMGLQLMMNKMTLILCYSPNKFSKVKMAQNKAVQ
ncbi:hypothetical protein BZZ01_09250 [Nostocales cyanobacterium HT-58-2]|nr:hypothetical protein BZZ01_09250 [Nostocales cyanobacterium HT-58-2]